MSDYSYIFNAHPEFVDKIYHQYQSNPGSVDDSWRLFFEGFDFADRSNGHSNGHVATASATTQVQSIDKEFGVLNIIRGFRTRGHLLSKTNPIKARRDRHPHLDLTDYQLSEADMDTNFAAGSEINMPGATLRQILDKLDKIYCGHIGFEYAYIENREKRTWLRDKIENRNSQPDYGFSMEQKKRILEKLNGAVSFEKFLHTKYVGQKRFSLEGGETTIAALDAIINAASDDVVEEVVIGMAHRGRLNVLANIMGKTYDQIFHEFEGTEIEGLSFGDGDVKYHLGFSSQVPTESGKPIELKLVPNPSHLEAVDSVVEGFSRSKADILYDSNYDKILPILLHGDAAVAGQGVVYETVQMSQLEGYYTGGTIHYVINNQIGFTTDFEDARSSTYCTAAASLVQAPVFHVNGDDPEAVIFVAKLAFEYRQKFNNDVFIDMVCYRRHGHNEGDDPKFTQPQMYELIRNHPNPRDLYIKQLENRGDISQKEADKMSDEFWQFLQHRLDGVKQNELSYELQKPEKIWTNMEPAFSKEKFEQSPVTGIKKAQAKAILAHLAKAPEEINQLSKVNRLLKGINKSIDNNQLDWALGELMAYGTLLQEGRDVRLSGQDVKRGTFSHRHAVFYDSKTYVEYNRLMHLPGREGIFRIYNSLLSEFAVLGFEYGYAMGSPQALVIWEAQFGDFANGAQTIIDQFIMAGESKWNRMNGITMLLPHGYEGQGPEHSSARLERFLQGCAEFNIAVINATTPANIFHALRRQVERPFRKPLVVMAPKSLLRHPMCVSPLEDFIGKTRFLEVLTDDSIPVKNVKKVIFCTGKVYYDLFEHRRDQKIKDTVIMRLEQMYPFPQAQVDAIRNKYAKAQFRWVQEEPRNMGAWTFLVSNHGEYGWSYVGRKSSASPATGFKKVHEKQQTELVVKAFE